MRTSCAVSVLAEALNQVVTDNEHRTQHWVQLIAIANSSGANDATIARLEKEVGVRSAVSGSRFRLVPRAKNLSVEHGALLHAPLWAEFHAHRLGRSQF